MTEQQAWRMDADGNFVNPPPPPYHCQKCGGLLVWRRTPLLPEPAGIWTHETEPEDDHAQVVPWEEPTRDLG
ncbi:hypothetical protein [Micromonospora chersina]